MASKAPAALTRATKGLLFPSETDAPFEPFVWGKADNSAAAVRRLAGQSSSAECQEQSLDEFLGDLLGEKEFQALRAAVEKTLGDPRVYRFGSVRVTYYIVGTTADGRLAGLKTTAVET